MRHYDVAHEGERVEGTSKRKENSILSSLSRLVKSKINVTADRPCVRSTSHICIRKFRYDILYERYG